MAGLKVKVNTSRSEGDLTSKDETNDLLKDILEVLKQDSKGADKERKMAASGLSKLLGGGAAVVEGLLGTGAGVIGGIGGGLAEIGQNLLKGKTTLTQATEQMYGQDTFYEKGTVGDETIVLEIEKKSGQILDTLTLEEAKRREILSKTGDIKTELTGSMSIYDDLTKDLKHNRDVSMLTLEDVKAIQTKTEVEKTLQQEIIELLVLKRDMLARQVKTKNKTLSQEDVLALGKGPIRQSVAYDIVLKSEQPAQKKLMEELYFGGPTNKLFVDLSLQGE